LAVDFLPTSSWIPYSAILEYVNNCLIPLARRVYPTKKELAVFGKLFFLLNV
jgi:hypothetical protein